MKVKYHLPPRIGLFIMTTFFVLLVAAMIVLAAPMPVAGWMVALTVGGVLGWMSARYFLSELWITETGVKVRRRFPEHVEVVPWADLIEVVHSIGGYRSGPVLRLRYQVDGRRRSIKFEGSPLGGTGVVERMRVAGVKVVLK